MLRFSLLLPPVFKCDLGFVIPPPHKHGLQGFIVFVTPGKTDAERNFAPLGPLTLVSSYAGLL